MLIVGQKSNLDLIKNWNTMPSFTIIQGSDDMGKTYFTKYLCNKFKLNYMLLDNKVDTVRKLVSNQTSNSGMLYHFKDFHKASINAKNALLKITEEPLPGNHIVITGLKQIDTLESRARIIKMQPYSDDELQEYINSAHLDRTIANKLIKCNFKTPSLLARYSKVENIDKLISQAESIAADILNISQSDVNKLASSFNRSYEKEDDALIFVEILCSVLEQRMLSKNYISFKQEFAVLFKLKHLLSSNPTFNRRLLIQSAFESLLFKE